MVTPESIKTSFVENYSRLVEESYLKETLVDPIKALTEGKATKLKFLIDLHMYEVMRSDKPAPYYKASLGTREVDDAYIKSLYAKGNRLINGVTQLTINEDDVEVYPTCLGAKLPISIVKKDGDCVFNSYINPVD
jgi:hypothetical protein